MQQYVLIFRMNLSSEARPTEKELARYMIEWNEWTNGIADSNRLADGGNHLSTEGRVFRKGGVERALYATNSESVAGYLVVLARSFEEACEIAARCPILAGEGTSVEVRPTAAPDAP